MNGLTKFLQILYGISVSDLPSAASNDRTGHQHKPITFSLFLVCNLLLSFSLVYIVLNICLCISGTKSNHIEHPYHVPSINMG
jgi:hypothetical protein